MSPSSRSSAHQAPPTTDRRNLLTKLAAVVVGGVVGLFPMVVGLLSFLSPLRGRRQIPAKYEQKTASAPSGYVRICALDALAVGGTPQRFAVIDDQVDAWNFAARQPIGAVFVERTGDAAIRVFNATCPHAGCSVSCDGAAYNCPCHNSSFKLDGTKRTSASGRENPSPRDLDSLDVDQGLLSRGEVWVAFKNFYTGQEEKIAKQ